KETPVSKDLIDRLFKEAEDGRKTSDFNAPEKQAIHDVIDQLDTGKIRVCTKDSSQWIVHEWIKRAILLYFRLQGVSVMKAGDFSYVDKVPVKNWTGMEGVRVVPHALARKGSHIESGAVLMPSYVNIGAWVGAGTM